MMRRSFALLDSALAPILLRTDALRKDYLSSKAAMIKLRKANRGAMQTPAAAVGSEAKASPQTQQTAKPEGAEKLKTPQEIRQAVLRGPLADVAVILKTNPLYSPAITPRVKKVGDTAATESEKDGPVPTTSDKEDPPTPAQLSNILATCAYFDCEDVDLLNNLILKIGSFHGQDLQPDVITRTMASCARLGFAHNEMLLKLVGAAKLREADFTGKSAARMIIAMGRFQFETTAVFRSMVEVLEREGTKNLTAKEAREVLYFLHSSGMPRNKKKKLITSLCSVVVRRWSQRQERVTPQDINFTVEAAREFGIVAPWLDDALLKVTRRKGVVVDHGGDTTVEDSVHFDAIAVDKVKLQTLLK